MTVTDVQPRVFMCPLPKGYWWNVRLTQRNDCAYLELRKRRNIGPLEMGCVLDISQKSTDRVVQEIINRSYEMWQKFFHASHNKNPEWRARADEIRSRLAHPGVEVKVTVEEVK